MASVPCVAFTPDHAPLAVQVAASVVVHDSVVVPPLVSVPTAALKLSVGGLLEPLPVSELVVLVPVSLHAAKVNPSAKTSVLFTIKDRKRKDLFFMVLSETVAVNDDSRTKRCEALLQ